MSASTASLLPPSSCLVSWLGGLEGSLWMVGGVGMGVGGVVIIVRRVVRKVVFYWLRKKPMMMMMMMMVMVMVMMMGMTA